MTDSPNRVTAALSRRTFLRAATGVAGAGLMVGATAQTAAAAKLSQQVVAYQDHPAGDKRCDGCTHFRPPSTCQIVDGPVRPDGYCKFFAPRGQV